MSDVPYVSQGDNVPEVDSIIWRCISYKPYSTGMFGFHNEVMFDDMVATERLADYVKRLEGKGVEKITIKKLGLLSYVMENASKLGFDKIRPGAERLAHEKKNHKLEEFIHG
ncbi:MAG: hypothetical protein E6L00_03495 [Thaumarchaeota archaeon]|nr:MAG: hypothetical protein E6L00_03495 [Nitrososphaerota archaeon]